MEMTLQDHYQNKGEIMTVFNDKLIVDWNRKTRFKVIKKKTRMSAMVNGHSKYARKYVAGTSVYAMEGTHGIFVFKHKTHAEDWVYAWSPVSSPLHGGAVDLIVVPVIPIGRGRNIQFICNGIDTDALDEYYHDDDFGCNTVSESLDDSVVHPGVHVLE
jgi:hypothetical protein